MARTNIGRIAVVIAATWLAGCDAPIDAPEPGEQPEPRHLVDNAMWQPAQAAEADPFADHQPDTIACTRTSFVLEHSSLELDTGQCNFFSLWTPLLTDVEPGDTIITRAFHDALAAPSEATAHLALSIGGHVIWDQEVDVPSPATPYTIETQADFEAHAGDVAVFHLHNHGTNTYRLLDVRVSRPGLKSR